MQLPRGPPQDVEGAAAGEVEGERDVSKLEFQAMPASEGRGKGPAFGGVAGEDEVSKAAAPPFPAIGLQA